MQAMIPFPDISPEIFSIDFGSFTFALRWYALAYITGILIGWRIAVRAVGNADLWLDRSPMNSEKIEQLVSWIIIGIILGGRLGYVLFYQPGYYFANPGEILMIWQGGMSFHGGFLGVVVAVILFSRLHKVPLGSTADILAIATPPGLMLGRIANFINAELWGSPSDVPWAVIFPGEAAQECVIQPCARHPSQLYEAGLEGLVLGGVLLFLAFRRGSLKAPWQTTGVFLIGYGLARFFVEFFRQADAQFISATNPDGNVIALGGYGLSMGQLLSLPMLVVGLGLILWARKRR
jgi:phosphatidylglycerol:prolipoprotein diacylglycerol transferase